MEEARKLDLRPLLAAAGVVAVILTIWATGAFGAGGGSSSGNQSSGGPAAGFVQSQNAQPAPGNCPEHGNGGGGGGSGGSSGGGSSGSGDL
jgi:hypothetical protein